MVAAAAAGISLAVAAPLAAQNSAGEAAGESSVTYADLADLTLDAPLAITAEVRRTSRIDPSRTGPVRPGWARIYVEAETKSLLAGNTPIGEKLKYLADVKLTSRGKVPKLKGETVVLFARPVPGSSDEIQLIAPDAQVPAAQINTVSLRSLLAEKLSPDAAPVVTGVRDVLHTPGNLAGEGETQIFLKTKDGSPASIAVVRAPSQPPVWGLSTGELVQIDARPPRPGTLEWYRLACSLPAALPVEAQLASDPALRQQAAADYQVVIEQLGPCERRREF
ncbi:hypothetical protein H4O24_01365 [Croceicoccus marinus]|jgi:hypothetical protein|uniref:Uncharacterized protein n=2 Tax=Croceicoccus marinus TaxID=450378 RepID=A0A7G6VXL1_9SPHN|nr:hypothetical protein H4O24_01365 [Croceicoccus marinus]